ncbi:MAG: glycoside hydrolase family 99-like domain-containing protein [Bacteroidales bacterium]|nr:glycoside hydrolase family 99-like domain-containing protein [Bacteroidales bacterium]
MRKIASRLSIIITCFTWFIYNHSCSSTRNNETLDDQYHVAAYIWPSCHDGERNRKVLWPEGVGEWEIIRKGTPRFEGHYQPKIPLWGYEMDNDPLVMERWIEKATEHGINVFIFDWYWFDGAPFLESSLNDGFLEASNSQDMDFYLMWANHDVKKNYWNHFKYSSDSLLWEGAVDQQNFEIITRRVIQRYFSLPNYYCINECPVFSIFSLHNFLESFSDVAEAKKALNYFRDETKKAGFPGLHLQLIGNGGPWDDIIEKIDVLGFNSVTKYNWGGPHPEDYIQWAEESMARRKQWDEALSIPYFPNASIGWDDTPRFPDKGVKDVVHYNNSPESFATYLQLTKEYLDSHPGQPKLMTIFSWNEWVEGGYLLPDMKYGYGYLDAVKRVLEGEYE